MQQVSYERDFYGWLMRNARLMRDGNFSEIDAENIAEELESMGKSEKRDLISRLAILLAHLLKWQFQTTKRSTSRKNTIAVQRIDIGVLLEDSPSLRHEVEEKIAVAYEKATLGAENETGIEKSRFPETCPFTLDQMLDKNFFPENR
jgi:hypothetical protein